MKRETYHSSKIYANLKPADRIRLACELSGISQAQVARRAGLHASHFSEILNGKRRIGVEVARRLSKVLDISVARLLDIDGNKDTEKKNIERALMRLRKHIKESDSIGENTEKILLKDVEEAIVASRKAS